MIHATASSATSASKPVGIAGAQSKRLNQPGTGKSLEKPALRDGQTHAKQVHGSGVSQRNMANLATGVRREKQSAENYRSYATGRRENQASANSQATAAVNRAKSVSGDDHSNITDRRDVRGAVATSVMPIVTDDAESYGSWASGSIDERDWLGTDVAADALDEDRLGKFLRSRGTGRYGEMDGRVQTTTGENGGLGHPRASLCVSKGLLNPTGSNNCFLNSAIQVLWQLDVFRQNFRLISGHACIPGSCIFCALKVIFTHFEFSDHAVLPPDALREALANSYADQRRFQLGLMDDAAECFENILLRIHLHLAYDEQEDSCRAPHCIPHRKFAMNIVEQAVCECSSTSEPLIYMQMVHYVSTTTLMECAVAEARRVNAQASLLSSSLSSSSCSVIQPSGRVAIKAASFGQLLYYAKCEGELHSCPSNCGRTLDGAGGVKISRMLLNNPEVISVGFVWESDEPSSNHIRGVINTISTVIRPADLFSSIVDNNWADTCEFNLVGLVCYYGKHYSTFFFHPKKKIWNLYDDARVLEIGSEWMVVVSKCCRSRYQPLLLLYTDSRMEPIDFTMALAKNICIPEPMPSPDPESYVIPTDYDRANHGISLTTQVIPDSGKMYASMHSTLVANETDKIRQCVNSDFDSNSLTNITRPSFTMNTSSSEELTPSASSSTINSSPTELSGDKTKHQPPRCMNDTPQRIRVGGTSLSQGRVSNEQCAIFNRSGFLRSENVCDNQQQNRNVTERLHQCKVGFSTESENRIATKECETHTPVVSRSGDCKGDRQCRVSCGDSEVSGSGAYITSDKVRHLMTSQGYTGARGRRGVIEPLRGGRGELRNSQLNNYNSSAYQGHSLEHRTAPVHTRLGEIHERSELNKEIRQGREMMQGNANSQGREIPQRIEIPQGRVKSQGAIDSRTVEVVTRKTNCDLAPVSLYKSVSLSTTAVESDKSLGFLTQDFEHVLSGQNRQATSKSELQDLAAPFRQSSRTNYTETRSNVADIRQNVLADARQNVTAGLRQNDVSGTRHGIVTDARLCASGNEKQNGIPATRANFVAANIQSSRTGMKVVADVRQNGVGNDDRSTVIKRDVISDSQLPHPISDQPHHILFDPAKKPSRIPTPKPSLLNRDSRRTDAVAVGVLGTVPMLRAEPTVPQSGLTGIQSIDVSSSFETDRPSTISGLGYSSCMAADISDAVDTSVGFTMNGVLEVAPVSRSSTMPITKCADGFTVQTALSKYSEQTGRTLHCDELTVQAMSMISEIKRLDSTNDCQNALELASQCHALINEALTLCYSDSLVPAPLSQVKAELYTWQKDFAERIQLQYQRITNKSQDQERRHIAADVHEFSRGVPTDVVRGADAGVLPFSGASRINPSILTSTPAYLPAPRKLPTAPLSHDISMSTPALNASYAAGLQQSNSSYDVSVNNQSRLRYDLPVNDTSNITGRPGIGATVVHRVAAENSMEAAIGHRVSSGNNTEAAIGHWISSGNSREAVIGYHASSDDNMVSEIDQRAPTKNYIKHLLSENKSDQHKITKGSNSQMKHFGGVSFDPVMRQPADTSAYNSHHGQWRVSAPHISGVGIDLATRRCTDVSAYNSHPHRAQDALSDQYGSNSARASYDSSLYSSDWVKDEQGEGLYDDWLAMDVNHNHRSENALTGKLEILERQQRELQDRVASNYSNWQP